MTHYRIDLIFIILLAGLALAISLAATTAGPGINPDAFVYISMAENLATGDGFVANLAEPFEPAPVKPVTLFAPGYSMLTAVLVRGGMSAVQAARLVSALGFAGLVAAVYWLTQTLAGRPAALVAGLTTVWLMPLVRTASFALSETTFMLFSVLSVAGLLQYLKPTNRSRGWLIFAAVCAGLSITIRYLGVLWPVAGGVALLVMGRHRWRRAVVDAFILGGVSFLFILPWIIRNYLLVGYVTGKNRQDGLHPTLSENIRLLTGTLSRDLIPSVHLGIRSWATAIPVYGWLALVLLIMISAFLLWRYTGGFTGLYRKLAAARQTIPPNRTKIYLGGVVAGYAMLYLAALMLLSTTTQFPAYDWPRYLAPVYPLLITVGVALWFGLMVWFTGKPDRRLWGVAMLTSLLWLIPYAIQTTGFVQAAAQGQAFTAPEWRHNPAIEALAAMVSDSDELYSDQPYVVALTLGRPVRHLPEAGQENRLPELIAPLTAHHRAGYVIVFKGALAQADPNFAKRLAAADFSRLAAGRDDIQLVTDLPEGAIYRLGALQDNLANQPTN